MANYLENRATDHAPTTNGFHTTLQPSPTANGFHTSPQPPDATDDCLGSSYSDIFTPAPPIAQSRYSRQLLIPRISIPGQTRISTSKVLIIGLGGLGSPASLYLAGAGIGTLGLLDDDVVERSNLHRQIAHREDSVALGMSKVASCARACREINSEIDVREYEMRVGAGRMGEFMEVVEGYDVVMDCSDNPATRYAISDVCVVLGKVLISGAAERLEGQVMVLNYVNRGEGGDIVERGPCYRCAFPVPPRPDMVKGCSEIGILGPVVGSIGTLMATECLRVIVKGGLEVRKPWMLLYSAWPMDPKGMFRTIGMRGRRKDCRACGDEEELAKRGLRKISSEDIVDGRMDYITFCGAVEDVKVLDPRSRVDAKEFMRLARGEKRKRMKVIDVREEYEVVLGPKIDGSINIPFPAVLAKDGLAQKQLQQLAQDDEVDSVIFTCPRGNDSQIAAKKLIDGTASSKFIGDIVGGFAALTKHVTQSENGHPP